MENNVIVQQYREILDKYESIAMVVRNRWMALAKTALMRGDTVEANRLMWECPDYICAVFIHDAIKQYEIGQEQS